MAEAMGRVTFGTSVLPELTANTSGAANAINSGAGAYAQVTDDEPHLSVVGGSGLATLMLQFQLYGESTPSYPIATSQMNFTVAVNGSTVLSTSCPLPPVPPPLLATGFVCPPVPSQPPFYMPVSVSIPVTFNNTFDLTEQLTASGGGSNGGVSFARTVPRSVLAGYSILDQNGNPIPGASLVALPIPEPGAFSLVCLSLIAILANRKCEFARRFEIKTFEMWSILVLPR
jgi:hypothetical protein